MGKTLGYARVSTGDGQDVTTQKAALEKLGAVVVFTETGNGSSLTGRDQLEAAGTTWPDEDEQTFRAPIREQFERQGSPYFATARLWDDGIVEPDQTRDLLGLALDIVGRVPFADGRFGLFRM